MQTQAWDNLNQKLPKIAIAIPYVTNWHPEWVEKTRDPLRYFPVDFCEKITFMSKMPSLPVGRDVLVNEALKVNADYIFFCDTDHVFESPSDPNLALRQLYDCINKDPKTKNAKIVSGLYRAKQKVGFNYAMWMKPPNVEKGYVPIQSWNGNWLEVDVVGLGCCLIDIQVFKETPKPWFYWETGDDISEDFYFCQLAKKYGYTTHVFTDVKLSHLGTLKVKCDGSIIVSDM